MIGFPGRRNDARESIVADAADASGIGDLIASR